MNLFVFTVFKKKKLGEVEVLVEDLGFIWEIIFV